MLSELLPTHAPSLVALAVLLITTLLLRYNAKCAKFAPDKSCGKPDGIPLTFPYVFPLLGSLPVAYLWKPRDFVLNQQ